jgi:glycosyltransferase involved in cell wall biosynthesis
VRILVLNWLDRENPNAGGAEVHLHETFGRLARRGHEVTAVTSGWPESASRTELDGIEVHRVGGRHSYPLHVAGHVTRRLADRRFDVVVEDLNKVPLFTPTWLPTPCLLLVHHLFGGTAFQEAPFPIAAATWALERPIPWIYRGTPTVAVSDSTREDLMHRGLPGRTIRVIPNGIDLDAFQPAADGRRYLEPTLVYLGRLKRYKRVDLVLKAVARLREESVAVRLLVAGKGDHRPALEAEARALGLDDGTVTFLGFVPDAERKELLARAWVHCLTSPKEGWGIANLEAAASGTPTVASDAPGLRDSVVHGETGFLVPHGDVEALAGALRRLLESPELRDALGRGGRIFAEGFSWDRTSDRMLDALQEVVASR